MARTTCITPECDENKYALDMCRKCYQRARYWNNKSLSERITFLKVIRIRANTMSMITNVRPISSGRRRRTG